MSQEQEAMEEEYQQRVDDLVTTLDELRELNIPKLDVEVVEEGITWRESSLPAAVTWRQAVDIVDEHIGGTSDLFALDSRIPTSVANKSWAVQCPAPQWLGDYIDIGVVYYPEGELGVFSSLILYKGGADVAEEPFYDGRLNDLDTEQLNSFRETAVELGPQVENWR